MGARARSLWSGSISFGLVNIPIRLFTATSSHTIGFHQLQAKTGQRIRYKRVAEKSGKEVPYAQIVKGYEVKKGKYVTIDPDELERLEPRKSRTIEIEQFVDLAEIDPIAWDQTYYVAPDQGGGAEKSFELLRRSMQDMQKVAIGRFVMREKEYLATIRPLGSGLALETMFYADELRDHKEATGGGSKKAAVSPREMSLAKQIIDGLSAPWDHAKFKDSFHDRVWELIETKSRGEEMVFEESPEPQGEVIDLMQALKASLDRSSSGSKPAKRARAEGKTNAKRRGSKAPVARGAHKSKRAA